MQQMETTKLNVLNNQWAEIHDFGEEQSVYKIKSNDDKFREIFGYVFEHIRDEIKNELTPINELVIPVTMPGN